MEDDAATLKRESVAVFAYHEYLKNKGDVKTEADENDVVKDGANPAENDVVKDGANPAENDVVKDGANPAENNVVKDGANPVEKDDVKDGAKVSAKDGVPKTKTSDQNRLKQVNSASITTPQLNTKQPTPTNSTTKKRAAVAALAADHYFVHHHNNPGKEPSKTTVSVTEHTVTTDSGKETPVSKTTVSQDSGNNYTTEFIPTPEVP